METLELARLAWQRAQADLQTALAELERLVANPASDVTSIHHARADVASRQRIADDLLNRYITYIGKTQ